MSKYIFPKELEPYRKYISGTGGNSIEDLVNRLSEKNLHSSNILVFTMAIAVESQVNLLSTLRREGLLSSEVEARAMRFLAENQESLKNFFDGRDGPYSDSRREMEDIVNTRRKKND